MHPEQAEIEDVELLRLIAGGDEDALAALYDRYHLILFGLILRILHSQPEAEDVLQETFLQVWRKAKDFDAARGRPFTWLVTLARSRAIDRLRSSSARARTVAAASLSLTESISDAADDAMKSEQGEIVRRALTELPEEQRNALVLAYFEGLTQSEIAARLKTPLGTVKTRMRSGMMRLRELLGGRADDLL